MVSRVPDEDTLCRIAVARGGVRERQTPYNLKGI